MTEEPKIRGHFQNGTPYAEPAAERREREVGVFKPRPGCKVCRHEERVRIEALRVAGVSLDKLAEQFGVSRDSVHRHCENHVSDTVKASYLLGPSRIADLANAAADESRSVLDYLTVVRSILMGALSRAAEKGKNYEIDRLSGRMIEALNAIGQVTGEVHKLAGSTINIVNNTTILNSAPFLELQTGLMQVCARHPEARADIIALFRQLDARHSGDAPKLIEAREAEHV